MTKRRRFLAHGALLRLIPLFAVMILTHTKVPVSAEPDQIPIVYTYTELSKLSGKILLKASIVSARQHMPNTQMHILYHGDKDTEFRRWLEHDFGVVIHRHEPSWIDEIERSRQKGDHTRSHLYSHVGNYLGTWQRIDIPQFIQNEYCILLDMDTIVLRPFTVSDFGDLSKVTSVAMSSEINRNGPNRNAGVLLMNLPRLRETYEAFINHIKQHVDSGGFKRGPGDQGAYLDFYENEMGFLSDKFNWKSYWVDPPANEQPFIVHFHGPKPHDYLNFLLNGKCQKVFGRLCRNANKESSFMCGSFQHFAKSLKIADRKSEYCGSEFSTEREVALCNRALQTLANKNGGCRSSFMHTLMDVLNTMTFNNETVVPCNTKEDANPILLDSIPVDDASQGDNYCFLAVQQMAFVLFVGFGFSVYRCRLGINTEVSNIEGRIRKSGNNKQKRQRLVRGNGREIT